VPQHPPRRAHQRRGRARGPPQSPRRPLPPRRRRRRRALARPTRPHLQARGAAQAARGARAARAPRSPQRRPLSQPPRSAPAPSARGGRGPRRPRACGGGPPPARALRAGRRRARGSSSGGHRCAHRTRIAPPGTLSGLRGSSGGLRRATRVRRHSGSACLARSGLRGTLQFPLRHHVRRGGQERGCGVRHGTRAAAVRARTRGRHEHHRV
jgi:hypothetical protein